MATSALRTTSRGDNRSIMTAAALSMSAALTLAGCSNSHTPSPTPSAPNMAPSSTDPTTAAKQQVLASYRDMWAAEVKAYSTGSLQNVALEDYAGDKALAGIRETAIFYQDHGIVLKGKPKLSPMVTAIDVTGSPATAAITDCIDSSAFVQVYKATGKPVDLADTNRRHVETATARMIGGKWLIMATTIDRARKC